MARPRTFDHARAQRLRAQGLSYPEIGRQLGVHHTAVLYAYNPEYRLRKNAASRSRAKVVRA